MRNVFKLLFLGLILFSCTYGTREGVVQKSSKSFFHFIGNSDNVVVVIDDEKPINLQEEPDVQRFSPNLLYEILPGKHTLKIYRDSKLIVDRLIYVASGETKEVEI